MARTAKRERQTKETDIRVEVNLDGKGRYHIATGIGFFNHMLELFSKHSGIDINLEATGDIDVDLHHTVEDVGILLGKTLHTALGEKVGIERFADAAVPMDETLARVAVDIGERAFLVFNVPSLFQGSISRFDCELVKEFMVALTNNLRANIHINVPYGENKHHIAEAIFKGLARAVKGAIRITGSEIPSTKGVL